jgi:hypothetical protein
MDDCVWTTLEGDHIVRTPMIPTLLLALALPVALALGCNSQDSTQPSVSGAGGLDPAQATAPELTPPADIATLAVSEPPLPPFNPNNFVQKVDNLLFPLPLGRRLVYRGTEDGLPEVVITDITRLHKTILGVPITVVLDRVFLDGRLKEKTFDWYAEDKNGNVWYFGEDTKEFDENGKVISTAGSFEAGKNGAKAGVIMRSHLVRGQVTPQEFAPGVAEDKARVLDLHATVTVPFGTFHECLKTEEFTALEPDVLENKFYCPRYGIVRERDARGGTVSTALVNVIQK